MPDEFSIIVDQTQIRFELRDILGAGACVTAATFSSVGWSPSLSILCPKYFTTGAKNAHLDVFKRKPAAARRPNTSSRLRRCSSRDFPVTNISSRYTTVPGTPCSKLSMIRSLKNGRGYRNAKRQPIVPKKAPRRINRQQLFRFLVEFHLLVSAAKI